MLCISYDFPSLCFRLLRIACKNSERVALMPNSLCPVTHWRGDLLGGPNQTEAGSQNLSNLMRSGRKVICLALLRYPSQFMETEPQSFCSGSKRICFL